MKKCMMKQILACVLALALMCPLFAGCTPADSGGTVDSGTVDTNTPGYSTGVFNAREITEGVKLTIAVPDDSLVSDWETNEVTLKVEEALGVDLEFLVLPTSDYASKLNVMVYGGDKLPDIIFDPSGWNQWVEEGAVADLTDYYANEDYSANIRAAAERCEVDLLMYMKEADGKQYAIPAMMQEMYAPVQQKLWIYKPWLDALGADIPTTFEEYYNLCKQVCTGDMNGNGKADEIAISGKSGNLKWFDCLMSSFIYAHEDSWRVVEDGKISFAYTTDEWKEGLKWIKKFVDEGLIPKETFTQDGASYNALYYSDTPVVFSFCDWNYTGTDTDRRLEYVCVPALEGPDGVMYSCSYPETPSDGAIITTDCENPLAAFLVCDYFCSLDVSLTQRFGKQGTDWDYWDDVKDTLNVEEYVPTFEGFEMSVIVYDNIGFWNSTEAQNVSYRKTGCYIMDKYTLSGLALHLYSSDADEVKAAQIEVVTAEAVLECFKYQPDEIYDHAPLTTDESEQVSDIKSAATSYVKEMTAQFLTGKVDIDDYWDEYLAELDKIGIDEYLEVLQVAYDRVH